MRSGSERVAQLDRALVSGTKGRGFESLLARHFTVLLFLFVSFFYFNLNALSFESLSAAELYSAFSLAGYSLNEKDVPAVFMKKFPDDMKSLDSNRRTRLFVKIMIPLILAENREIISSGNKMELIIEKGRDNWDDDDYVFMMELGAYYRTLKGRDLKHMSDKAYERWVFIMRRRVLPVSPAIALGQAALESGWGTSRFVRLGNNLFGHVAVDYKKGIKPLRWNGKKRHIKIFASVSESIKRYMRNLNTNSAYLNFRRARLRNKDDIYGMAQGFDKYSRIKEEYIDRLWSVIRKYGLYKYEDFSLSDVNLYDIAGPIESFYIN